jgi:hypothetical protein
MIIMVAKAKAKSHLETVTTAQNIIQTIQIKGTGKMTVQI